MERHRVYGLAAAAILFVAAAIELSMILADVWWTRFGERHNHIIALVLAVLWTVSATAILLRLRSPFAARAAFVLGIASTLALFAHSLVGLGVIYLPAALVVGFLLLRTFRSEWDRLRSLARRDRIHRAS